MYTGTMIATIICFNRLMSVLKMEMAYDCDFYFSNDSVSGKVIFNYAHNT